MEIELQSYQMPPADAGWLRHLAPEISKFDAFYWVGSSNAKNVESQNYLVAADRGDIAALTKHQDVADDVFFSILCSGNDGQLILTFRTGEAVNPPVIISKTPMSEPLEIVVKAQSSLAKGLKAEVRWSDILKRLFS